MLFKFRLLLPVSLQKKKNKRNNPKACHQKDNSDEIDRPV